MVLRVEEVEVGEGMVMRDKEREVMGVIVVKVCFFSFIRHLSLLRCNVLTASIPGILRWGSR
jgi:hypothetical protein